MSGKRRTPDAALGRTQGNHQAVRAYLDHPKSHHPIGHRDLPALAGALGLSLVQLVWVWLAIIGE